MIKYEIYNNEKTYQFPNGDIAYPTKMQQEFPAITTFPHLIETDEYGQICYAVINLSALKGQYNINPLLTNEEAIIELESIRNAPPAEPQPSAEERIAAAMEFQNMVALSSI